MCRYGNEGLRRRAVLLHQSCAREAEVGANTVGGNGPVSKRPLRTEGRTGSLIYSAKKKVGKLISRNPASLT